MKTAQDVFYKDLEVNLAAHRVSRAGHELCLTPREFALLAVLLTHCDTPLAVSKLDSIKQFGPAENQLFDGTAIQARYLYDLFVPEKRIVSIGAVVEPA